MDAVVPAGSRWCCTSSMVTTLLCCPTESTGCPLCPTGVLIDPVAAVLLDLIGCWFPLRRLKLICSSPGVNKSTCTLISRVDLDSADGVRAHSFWMYCRVQRNEMVDFSFIVSLYVSDLPNVTKKYREMKSQGLAHISAAYSTVQYCDVPYLRGAAHEYSYHTRNWH